MKNKGADRILVEAYYEEIKQEHAKLPSDEELRREFPITKEKRDEFIKRIYKKKKPLYITYLQRVAAFILVFAIVTFSLMMTDTVIKGSVFEMISNDDKTKAPLTYDSYIEYVISQNENEIKEVFNALKEQYVYDDSSNDQYSAIAEDLVKLYRFTDEHIVNVYREKHSLADNFEENYEYVYFNDENQNVYKIHKEAGKWEVYASSLEIKFRQENFPGQPYNFKEMIAEVIKQYPNLDPDSVKYVLYHPLAAYLIYFSCEDTEYIINFPPVSNYPDDNDYPEYATIYTLSEYIDIVDEYAIFNCTKPPDEGAGGSYVGLVKAHTPIYLYPIAGLVTTILLSVLYTIVKKHA